MSQVVESGRFILSNLGNNNNKFWNIYRYADHTVETHYGRVGDTGQRTTKDFGYEGGAIHFYYKKIEEKTAKGYQPVQTLEADAAPTRQSAARLAKEELAEVAKQQIRYSSPQVEQLVTYLTEQNVHGILSATTMQYDASKGTFSTPLGIVTSSAISKARGLLIQIGDFVAAANYSDRTLEQTINEYLMLVPQNIGRRRQQPQDLFPNLTAVQRQNSILDSLDASLQQVLSAPKVTDNGDAKPVHEAVFDVKLELVEDGKEIDRIRRKFRETAKSMHECSHLDVHRVYMVEIGHMRQAFEKDGAKMTNIWELWHGTRVGNLLSIMKGGFVIPPSNAGHCTGRLFGNGIYHSDQSTKSLNYAYGYWSSGQRDENCFMFLNNVALGNYYHPRSTGENLPKSGYDSTYAEGGKCGVLNNEMIVYRTAQVDPVFLIQFTRGGR